MYNFTYPRASGLRQASNMLGKFEEAKLLAGGQTLLPTMKLRLASPSHIIDLNKIEGLFYIELKGGAGVIRAVAGRAHMIGDSAVPHRSPIGGSVPKNDPNADYPAACLGLGATITTT